MNSVTPCMGGWCHMRDHCAHYHSTSRRRPAERLCYRGEDGQSDAVAVVLHRPIGTWSTLPAAPVKFDATQIGAGA